MKAKLVAGAEFDFLTKNEAREAIDQALQDHLRSGVVIKPVVSTSSDPNLPGQITIVCPDGYMWDVRSLYAVKTAADFLRLSLNNTANTRLRSIPDDGDNGNEKTFTKGDLVVRGGQSLISTAKTAGTNLLSVVLWVMEVPDGHDWQLK